MRATSVYLHETAFDLVAAAERAGDAPLLQVLVPGFFGQWHSLPRLVLLEPFSIAHL